MQQLRDVWNKATGTLVRNRGALQGQLASRCG
jgi:xanthine dehydrogenase iron-sulfur cluster and FAD-binding subunit A